MWSGKGLKRKPLELDVIVKADLGFKQLKSYGKEECFRVRHR